MCNTTSDNQKRLKRNDYSEEFRINTSFIGKRSSLRFIKNHPCQEADYSWPQPHASVYPKASIYYPFIEDTNPFTRFNSTCESRKYGNVQPHFKSLGKHYATPDPYSDVEARKQYLETKPTCIAIFSKPGLNTIKLATMIADSYNCILISPMVLLKEEIDKKSEKGEIIEKILRIGLYIRPEIIMNLTRSRLKKRDTCHRGYILEGLPLVPSNILDYSSYPSSNIESNEVDTLSINFMKIFGFPINAVCGTTINCDERTSTTNIDSLLDSHINYEDIILKQIDEIFSEWPLTPSIIINVTCPNKDAVKKRDNFRMDPETGDVIDMSLPEVNKNIEVLFPHHGPHRDTNISFELYKRLTMDRRTLYKNREKYFLRRISDLKSNVERQNNLYKTATLPAIEKWILSHNPQNVIRVDSRIPETKMFQIISVRLRILPVQRLILPSRLTLRTKIQFQSDPSIAPRQLGEAKDTINEEVLEGLSNSETISSIFPWRLSSWGCLCPVELTQGRTVEGLSKYAVRFLDQMFFLSSFKAINLFIENPRTFLLPPNPRPTCKIAVFGPRYSGKSHLCKELALVFKGTVINVNEIEKSFADAELYTNSDEVDQSAYMTTEEKVNIITNAIENIPKEEIETELWRDGGYIVDGMYTDVDVWDTIAASSEIMFEDVIYLFDEEPYEYLLNKWRSIDRTNENKKVQEYTDWMEDEDEDLETSRNEDGEEETEQLTDYVTHVQSFMLNWELLKEKVEYSCRNLVNCPLRKVDNILGYVTERIRDRYLEQAKIMSDDEKEKEKELEEGVATIQEADVNTVKEDNETEDERKFYKPRTVENNRRFGDSNHYCPVALSKHVLWRGRDEFSALFMDKIYLLSSSKALEEFVENPRKFSIPFVKPPTTIPPFRVSIVGPLGSGKSILSNMLSREYGLTLVDYFQCFSTYMKDRGMLPISRKDVLISSHKFTETELPEDLQHETYNSDPLTIETFIRRYWRTGGTLPKKMFEECLLTFFKPPYKKHEIIFDGFPSCSQDVKMAFENYTVPEVIIELKCNKDMSFGRAMPGLLASWRQKQAEKIQAEYLRYTEENEDYIKNREDWIRNLLQKEDRNEVENEFEGYAFHLTENDQDYREGEKYEDFEDGALSRTKLEEIWRQEHPKPVLFTEWEDFETARERIVQEFEETYEQDSQKLDLIRGMFEDTTIPWIEIDTERSIEEVVLSIIEILEPYISRDNSVLEKTYTVDSDTAEKLLDCGYYFLSSFGRWCPAQLHENKLPLQMFLTLEMQQEIYPVIHRRYIYFLAGKEASSKFSKAPLKYLEQDCCVPLIPLRVSIIGPPRCGKSTLAERFAKEYSMKIITRGQAIRHLLKYCQWTESARLIESDLRAGRIASDKSVAQAVEVYSIDPSSASQGFILDGFPESRKEYEELTFLGLQPMIVLDLKANLDFCLECLARGTGEMKRPPNFSPNFLIHRYTNWRIGQESFRYWLRKFSQNVIDLDATKSIWYVWTRANEAVCSRFYAIRTYFRECDYDKVHSLEHMCVSPYEFKTRQSQYEAYCPLCLFYKNTMTTSTSVSDNRGMVQYREHFYWICSQHISQFIKNPLKYLPPLNTAILPKTRPRILIENVDEDHFCWTKRLQAGGYCLVTYVENLPRRKLVRGKSTLSVMHDDKVYVFCNVDCRNKFLAQCSLYTDVDIHFRYTMPEIDLKSLPTLGFLEQTVAKQIVEATNQVGILRPKIPGLSSSVSAAIYVGIYLKLHNVSCVLNERDIYEIVRRRVASRDTIIKLVTDRMKKTLNPYLNVPVYRNTKLMDHLSIISRISSHTANLIKFRRTSPTQTLVDPDEILED